MAGIVLKLAFIGIFPAVALSLHGAWDPQLAAKYLDARQHGRKPRSAPALVAQAPGPMPLTLSYKSPDCGRPQQFFQKCCGPTGQIRPNPL
jgi:hypothetical protein